jgi:hypothetical protein
MLKTLLLPVNFALFVSILLDLTFEALFFIDGRSDISTYLKEEFIQFDLKKSIADIFVKKLYLLN